jgi:hypothetical protein
MSSRRVASALPRAIAAALPLACGIAGLVLDNVLAGGAAWLVALAASLAGWGHLVARRVDPGADAGLHLAWGAAVIMAAAGWLMSVGALTRPAVLALIAVGLAAHLHREATAPAPSLVIAGRWLAGLTARPQVAAFWLLAGAIAAVNLLAALAQLDGNVFDDDVIYTPLTRRLLEVGDIDEPYSFRRLSAYGGQTVLQALGAARGTLANLFLVDGGLFQLVTLGLVVGLASERSAGPASRGGPSGPELGLGLLVLVVLLLPSTAVNTASYWTGVALFLALYRTLARAAAATRPAGLFVTAGAVAAAACTLRQSYLPVALLFLGLVLVFRLAAAPAGARAAERRLWLAALAGGAVALVPYLISAYRSNQTFLYPFWSGTGNPNVHMRPAVPDLWHELQFFIEVALEPDPIRVMVPLAPLLLLIADRRAGRPLTALTIASGLGFLLLVHSFLLSVPQNLWRYAFGYATALVLVLVAEATRDGADDRGVQAPAFGPIVILACLVIQLAVSSRGLAKEYRDVAADLVAAAGTRHADLGTPAQRQLHAELQALLPAGAPLVVMLDEPFHLDHRRNPIANLDTPGFASPGPGMPFFEGAEAVAGYFGSQDVRYLAFVRGDRSRYMYRRDYWLHRMFFDTELWRMQAAYAVDCIDNLAALAATRRVLFERDGIVLVDLEARP